MDRTRMGAANHLENETRRAIGSIANEDPVGDRPDLVLFDNLKTKKLLTAQQAANLLSVSVKSVYLWAKIHRLPSVRLGSSVRFRRDDIERIIDGKQDL